MGSSFPSASLMPMRATGRFRTDEGTVQVVILERDRRPRAGASNRRTRATFRPALDTYDLVAHHACVDRDLMPGCRLATGPVHGRFGPRDRFSELSDAAEFADGVSPPVRRRSLQPVGEGSGA